MRPQRPPKEPPRPLPVWNVWWPSEEAEIFAGTVEGRTKGEARAALKKQRRERLPSGVRLELVGL